MPLHSLAKNRIFYMSRKTNTSLTEDHMRVLEFAWNYYRANSVGPLFNNIKKGTGVAKDRLTAMFPAGISSVYTWVGIPIQSRDKGCKPMATIKIDNPRAVYFDHNATTPLRSEVVDAMVDFLKDPESFGNPSSSYEVGSRAYDIIDTARAKIAACLGAPRDCIHFVGSGSEANNLAIKGITERYKDNPENNGSPGHIVCSSVEHPSVLETVQHLESEGFDVTWLSVATDGSLDASQVSEAIRDDTALVTVMAANNEIGTIYPYADIARVCAARNVPFFVDGVQGFGKIPIRPKEIGISALSLSGHKIYAPKGIAAIYIDPSLDIAPQIHGGHQETGLRAGTENVLGIMALGLAAELACTEMDEEHDRFLKLQSQFLERLKSTVPGAVINGGLENRLAHNLSVGFPGVDSGSLLLSLNQIGIAVSAGSACSAGEDKISHVLAAIGADHKSYGTIRFSFGKETQAADINYLFDHLPTLLHQLDMN